MIIVEAVAEPDSGWKPKPRLFVWIGGLTYRLEMVLVRHEKPEQRLRRLERQLEKYIRTRGPDAFATTNCKSALARALEQNDHVGDACVLRRETFEAFTRHNGADHWRTLEEQMWLADDLGTIGATEEADRHAKKLLNSAQVTLGNDHRVTKWAADFLGNRDSDCGMDDFPG